MVDNCLLYRKKNRNFMRKRTATSPILFLAAGSFLAFPLTSCTTTSNLSAVSQSNIEAVARISKEEPASATRSEAASESIGSPADLDPVAQERPVQDLPAQPKPAEVKPPFTLASVPLTSVDNLPTNQIMMVRTTAYSHLQADSLPYGRLSAAGNTLQYGSKVRSAAADWSKFPMGTRFMIEGLPYEYVVDDYGSALTGTKTIDIYKPNLAGIGQWGARNIPIRVLEWGSFEESRKILDSRKHVRHAHHVRTMLREIEKKGETGSFKKSTGGSA